MTENTSEHSRSRSRSRSPIKQEDKDKDINDKDEDVDDIGCYLFVSNLPQHCNFMQIDAIFKSFKGHEQFSNNIAFIHRAKGCTDGFKGKCVIQFNTEDACDNAIDVLKEVAVDGKKLFLIPNAKNKVLDLSFKKLKNLKKPFKTFDFDKTLKNENPAPDPEKYKNHDLYGLSVKFLWDLGIVPPLTNKLFVNNLETHVTELKIREVFSLAGHVVTVLVIKSTSQVNTGMARILYDHPVEAVQAISMFNNKPLFGRQMKLKLDKYPQKQLIPVGLGPIGMGLGPNGEPMNSVRYNIEMEPLKNLLLKELEKLKEFNNSQKTSNGNNPFQQNKQAGDGNPFNYLMQMLRQNFTGNDGSLAMALQQAMANQNQAELGNMFNQSIGANQNANPIAFANQSQPQSRFDIPPVAVAPAVNQNELLQQWGYYQQNQWQAQPAQQVQPAQNPWQAQPAQQVQPAQQPKSRFDIPPSGVTAPSNPNAGQNWTSGGWNQMQQQTADYRNVKVLSDGTQKATDVKKPDDKESDMLLFTNLPSSVTSQALVNKMSEVGALKMAEITGQGRAVVRFQQHEHAVRCIKLYDRSKVDGQEITVKFI